MLVDVVTPKLVEMEETIPKCFLTNFNIYKQQNIKKNFPNGMMFQVLFVPFQRNADCVWLQRRIHWLINKDKSHFSLV